ncbi:MAG: lysophospholipid acyltransferase family protein [Chitinophagales bacterium]
MTFFRYLYSIWGALLFAIAVIIAVPITFVGLHTGDIGTRFRHAYYRYAMKLWGILTFVKYNIVGEEHLEADKNYVFASNHTSYGDVPIVAATLSHKFVALAKKEAGDIPVMGYLFKALCVLVDRKDKESRKNSVIELKKRAAKGLSLLVFPEGTFSDAKREVILPFHTGAFRLAIELQQPVVPIALVGTRSLFTNDKLPLRPCTITMIYGEPISIEGLTLDDAHTLRDQVFEQIENTLLENDPIYHDFLMARQQAKKLS